ncbi:NAD(P)/FAD-dependent oxidoreductase [Flavobacterium zepuense]|uniref:NAD(P)/FAD-dependent oxidoreductase n=1 Tax=Flavobacterium zepuense TaxID=2593302 RepID=UPI002938DDDB|nr:hypothetical protein [Flavobacterium zepuense]
MIGDTAGLIHPLCGNGMAMALHSAKIAAELVLSIIPGNYHPAKPLKKNMHSNGKSILANGCLWAVSWQN